MLATAQASDNIFGVKHPKGGVFTAMLELTGICSKTRVNTKAPGLPITEELLESAGSQSPARITPENMYTQFDSLHLGHIP